MRWSNGIVVTAAAALTLCGCSGKEGGQSAGRGRPVDRLEQVTAARAPAADVALGTGGGLADTSSVAVTEPPAPDQAPAPAATTMIIRTGNATIQVDSLEPAVAKLRALAQQLGGYVGNTSMQTGTDQLRSATVEIKVPAERWSQLLNGLKPVGTLESVTEEAEDVGEEFVDVQARVANARRLEQRLIALLAERTGKLSDALAVERELARVREEIDRYEGRIRYLRSRAAISTMTVVVHEPKPVLGSHPGDNPIAQAFRDAWRIFVSVLAFLIESLGVIIPLALIVWVIWLIRGRRLWRGKSGE